MFLASDERPEGTMIYPELFGYIFAIACSPVAIAFEEWFPLIFNDHAPQFADANEEKRIKQAIFAIYQDAIQQVRLGQVKLPDWCVIENPPMTNFAEESMLTHWSRGVVEGHHWLADVWKTYISPKQDGELSTCFMVLSYFSSENLAKAYCDEYAHLFSHTLEDMAETVADTFLHAMTGYAQVGRAIAEQVARIEMKRQQANTYQGQDSLCPCGSGKSFKICCLH